MSREAAAGASVLASSMALSDDIGLPGGVVTFLFTDVQGSTRLWEDFPDLMMQALDQHDAMIDDIVASHNGVSVKPRGEGDSRFVVFTSAFDAVTAVVAMQRGLAEVDWRTPRPLLVRMALHTGEADLQLGDYYGPTVNRAARLRAGVSATGRSSGFVGTSVGPLFGASGSRRWRARGGRARRASARWSIASQVRDAS